MINSGKTAGLNFCGSRNEKQTKTTAARNANHKYHRRKTGRRFASNSQRPAGKCKGMSHKGCNSRARPRGASRRRGQNKNTQKAEDHQNKRRRPPGMPFPAQQPEKEPKNSTAVKNADRSQERRSPRQNFRGENFFLFRSQVLLSVFAGLHRAFQICGQEARFSRARRSIDLCSHQQRNPKPDPGHPSEIGIQHLPECLLAGAGQNHRRTRDPFDDIPWTS